MSNNYLGLPILVFDLNVTNGPAQLEGITVNISSPVGGSGGGLSTAYLYQGSTLVSTATVQPSGTRFTNITFAEIPGNVTIPFTVKVDVIGVTAGPGFTVSASVFGPGITLGAQDGKTQILAEGAANGNVITVVSAGPVFSLAGSPTIQEVNVTPGGAMTPTFKYTATFNVNVTAVGEDVNMGTTQSSWPAFWTSSSALAIIVNGGGLADAGTYGTLHVGYSIPNDVTVLSGALNFQIAKNQTVTIPVTYTWTVTGGGANTYSAELQQINWYETNGTTYVDPVSDIGNWKTSSL